MPGDFLLEGSVFAISENTTIPLGRILKFLKVYLGYQHSDWKMLIILSNAVCAKAAKAEVVLRNFSN